MIFVKYNDCTAFGEWIECGETWEEAFNNLKANVGNEYLNIQECEFYETKHIIIKTEVYSK